MGFIDTAIVNLQRIAGDVVQQPQSVLDRTIGAGQGAVGVAGQAVGGLFPPLLGMPGPRAAEGLAGDPSVLETIVVTARRPVTDLSTFAGGFWSGGNGMFATRTTVERLEIATGRVTIVSRMPGSPHLMNSEINAAKKVFRRSAALQKRLPRKTVKESEVTKLKNAAVAAATAAVSCPTQICPPKC